jgi:alcohol dehydrogenase class IV
MNLGFYMPTKVIVGKDCVRENSDVFKIGKKALIVTGKKSAKLSGALDDVKYALEKNNIEYVIFDKVMSNPTVECVYDGAETAMEEEVDFVIAIGGGSPMDSAKAIALLAVSDIERTNLFDGNIGNKALPMIHIPTTAGTGSEVTPYAILTNHEKQTKKSIASPCLFPTYALLDAKYTKNLGLATTVNTAIDSLSHSVEGMMSKRANVMADVIAKEAIKIIASTFDDLISGELTEDDREKLLYASMLGGVVISQTKTTAVHAMGYSLTYFKNIDHGRANGLLLGEFTKYIERNDKDRVKEILSCMNLDSAEEFKNILVKILGDKEKFEKEELELYAEIAQNAGGTLNSMFVPSKDEILQIYVESLM